MNTKILYLVFFIGLSLQQQDTALDFQNFHNGSIKVDGIGPRYQVSKKEEIGLLGPGNYSLEEGNELALICQGSPNLNLTWSKLDGLMPTGDREIPGEQVIIQHVTRKHAGTYRCQDKHNPQLFTDKIVNVLYGPEVKVSKIYIHNQGSVHLNLICQVNSNPKAQISWYKDGFLVKSQNQVSDVLVYKIAHPGPQHLGVYTCFANNTHTGYDSLYLTGLEGRNSNIASASDMTQPDFILKVLSSIAIVASYLM
eukprot:TRINITY_DN38406_c0_g1_i1.p1 TRINITY_DN38406_c0_g1~~TRINITY_DN38406_c0_g1_i1.p1  ORF type:complete len:264 (-),score=43.80 TRINITY_DN38406_c0_g1_i1:35-793(-)